MNEPTKTPFIQSDDRPPPPDDVIFYTVDQVAHLFEVHTETVKRWLADRQLEAIKVNGRWRISLQKLRAFAASNAVD